MIRRHCESEFFLIAQHEHAQLAGRLAERFGNAHFAVPQPAEATLAAVGLHDSGWPAFDERPALNPEHLPPDVFATPLPVSLGAWSASVQSAGREGDYAELLVSVHVLGLSGIAGTHKHTRAENFEINRFQQEQIERQEQLRRRLGLRTDLALRLGLAPRGAAPEEDLLSFNAALLAFADRISLAMCYERELFPQFEGIGRRPGEKPIRYRLIQADSRLLQVDPWPFDTRELSFDVPFRRISDQPFADDTEFHRALAAAPPELLRLTVRAG